MSIDYYNTCNIDLLRSVQENNIDDVKEILETNNYDLSNPLYQHYAALYNHYQILQLLLDHGANPNNGFIQNTAAIAMMRANKQAFACIINHNQFNPSASDNQNITSWLTNFENKINIGIEMLCLYIESAAKNGRDNPVCEAHIEKFIANSYKDIIFTLIDYYPEVIELKFVNSSVAEFAQAEGYRESRLENLSKDQNIFSVLSSREKFGLFHHYAVKPQITAEYDSKLLGAASSSNC